MARSILALTLLVALAAPSASAFLAANDLSPLDPQVPDASDVLGDAPQTADGVAEEVAQAVEDALACQTVVRVDLTAYGARVTDHREGGTGLLDVKRWTDTVTERVPVYEQVTETVGAVLGEDGILQPVTRTVERLTGYDVHEVVRSHEVTLAASATWEEDYLTWDTYEFTYLVTLPVGAPYVVAGEGVITQECDATRPILDHVPDPDAEGVDYWCVGCDAQPDDGWLTRILSTDVHVATPDEMASMPYLDGERGIIVCPNDVLATLQEKIAAYAVTLEDEANQATAKARAAAENAPDVEPEIGPEMDGASMLSSQAGRLVAAALGVAAILGTAIVLVARRMK